MYFRASRGMNNIEDRYFSVNRTLLLALGLWPYRKSILAQFHFIFFSSILISRIICQLIIFQTSKRSTNVIVQILSPTFTCIIFAIKYNAFCINSQTIRCLMEQLQRICNDLKDNNEIAIMEKYGNIARRYTISLTMVGVSLISIFMIAQVPSNFLNFILSANETWLYRLQSMTEYSIIKEKYFYLQLLHINLVICIGILTMVATGTMLNAYLKYACGMFRIASYRIEHAMKIYLLQDNPLDDNLIYKGMIYAVDIHRKAMMLVFIMFCEYLISQFQITYILLIIFGVISVSVSTFQIFQMVLLRYNVEAFSIPVANASTFFIYMLLANLMGQEIIDHNNYVYITAYKVHWYTAPPHTQRMILFLLQRSTKIFRLNIGGLYVASLEYFAMMIKAIMSYVTVMCSTRL